MLIGNKWIPVTQTTSDYLKALKRNAIGDMDCAKECLCEDIWKEL